MMRLAAPLFGLLIALITQVAFALPTLFQEGKEYQRAPQDIHNNPAVIDLRKSANGKVQVMEFFSYGCNWCFKLDPFISNWEKTLPDYVTFERVPVEFQVSWHTLAKAYYTARDLKAMNTVHHPLFEAIQTGKMTDSSEETLRKFFEQHGIKPEDFNKTFTSFNVDRQEKWASSMAKAYRITAVPAIIVQGPTGIYVSTVRMAGSEENLLKVVNFLIAQEHSAIAQNKQ